MSCGRCGPHVRRSYAVGESWISLREWTGFVKAFLHCPVTPRPERSEGSAVSNAPIAALGSRRHIEIALAPGHTFSIGYPTTTDWNIVAPIQLPKPVYGSP